MILLLIIVAGMLLASHDSYDKHFALKTRIASSVFFGSILVFLANAGFDGSKWVYEWCVYAFYAGGFWLFFLACKAPSQLLKKHENNEEGVSDPAKSLIKRAQDYIYSSTLKAPK